MILIYLEDVIREDLIELVIIEIESCEDGSILLILGFKFHSEYSLQILEVIEGNLISELLLLIYNVKKPPHSVPSTGLEPMPSISSGSWGNRLICMEAQVRRGSFLN
jgi:hypothetical protein